MGKVAQRRDVFHVLSNMSSVSFPIGIVQSCPIFPGCFQVPFNSQSHMLACPEKGEGVMTDAFCCTAEIQKEAGQGLHDRDAEINRRRFPERVQIPCYLLDSREIRCRGGV